MFGAIRTRAVLIALLVVAVALITIDFRDGGNSGAHSLGGRVFGPVERLAGDVTGVFRGSAGNGSELANLQKQNDQLRAQLAQAQTANADAKQLTSLLHLSKGKYKVVAGTVIAAGGNYSDTVTVNIGSADGIAANETVLNGSGLVGTVASVTGSTATVQLANGVGTTVGVRMAGTNEIGALAGSADSLVSSAPLKLTLFNANATLQPGQTLVTFGSVGGRPYVPGVPVGTVTAVTTQPGSLTPTALVQPFADFTGLGVVGVVVSK
ncbi:MAG TPA: rod shape-determining protein MreC [Trebonia sp.]|nr:rod shape-determining protein MreC [Trebonia sp.]